MRLKKIDNTYYVYYKGVFGFGKTIKNAIVNCFLVLILNHQK